MIKANMKCGSQNKEVSAETITEMVENNWDWIVKAAEPGNEAGYLLKEVYMEMDEEHQDTAVLHILALGSDIRPGYDPAEDKPEERRVYFEGITKKELPEKLQMEIARKEKFDPLKAVKERPELCAGVLAACVDHLAEAAGKEKPGEITDRKYPTMRRANFQAYISQLLLQFNYTGIKKIKKNADVYEIIEAAVGAADMAESGKKCDDAYILSYYKTKYYLYLKGKVPALKKYRIRAGLTQAEVAEKASISTRQYQRYEAKDSSLGDTCSSMVETIARTVGAEPEDLVQHGCVVMVEE